MGSAAAAEAPSDSVVMNNADDTSLEVSANTGGAEPILGASNEENQTLMSINENTELLSESNSGTGSFAELEQYIIDNKGYEKTVTLTKDYSFNNETDMDYNVSGVYLGTYVTIDGQGHTIDAKNSRYIFNIIGQFVTLKNIVFKNTNYRAINIDNSNVQILNCTFDNNTDRAVGLSGSATNCVIDNCTFINGQGIYSDAFGAVIRNSIFKNNTAPSGGAIQIAADSNVIENCEFINNTATNGGAIYFKYDPCRGTLTVKNSKFIENEANRGGAIYSQNAITWNTNWESKSNTVNVISSVFSKNKAVQDPELGGPEISSSPAFNVDDSTSRDGGLYYDEIDSIFQSVTGGEINLDKDYSITSGPIIIDKLTGILTINGNNHTIDANGNQVFNFLLHDASNKIIINDLIIKNAKSSSNGASIYIQAYSTSTTNFNLAVFNNCDFINSTTSNTGGAVYITLSRSGKNPGVIFKDCEFKYNTAANAGSIYVNTPISLYCQNSNFINSTALNIGGVIYHAVNYNRLQVTGNTFINCSADSYGVIYQGGLENAYSGKVKNNTFINCSAHVNPIGLTLVDTNDVINETIIHYEKDLADYFINIENNLVTLPKNADLNSYSNIMVPSGVTVDGNGAIIHAKGNVVFTSGKLIKNLTIINGTLRDTGYFTSSVLYENLTFINSSSIQVSSIGKVSDAIFINCSSPLNSGFKLPIYWDNIIVDDVKYNQILDQQLKPFYKFTLSSNLMTDLTENMTITLEKNDYSILSTIPIIGNNIILDGNGSTISSVYGQQIFHMYGSNITIRNFVFKDSNNPLYFHGYHTPNQAFPEDISQFYGNVINCSFINVTNAIYSKAGGTVKDCNFTNGSGYAYSMDTSFNNKLNLSNSNFENYKMTSNSLVTIKNGDVTNCNFTNITTLTGKGAAITINTNANINNSNFRNCSALTAGSIYQSNANGVVRVSKSSFDGNVAKANAGAIYVEGTLILDDCELNNNTADSSGAIYSHGNLIVTNSSLTNNSAVLGGAISSDGDNAVISDCNVSGNTAVVGAGISLTGDNATVDNVTFTDNAAEIEGGALITTGSGTNITNVTATGNSANKGAAFSLKGDNSIIANSTIANNTGINDGNIVNVEGNNIIVSNNTIQNNTGIGLYIRGNDTNITNNHFNNLTDISIDPTSNVYEQLPIEKIAKDNYPFGDMPLKEIVPTIIAKDVTVEENTVFNITLVNNDFTGNVSITVGDIVLYNDTITSFKDGAVYCPVISVGGDKTAQVFFYGDNAFRNKTVDVDFIVSRITPTMNVTINNVTYGINTTAKINISNKADGIVNITFGEITVNGSVVDGSAVIDLGMLVPDNYTAIIEFFPTDSDYYNNVSDTSSFNVAKANATLSVTTGQNNVFAYGDNVTVFISLVDNNTFVGLNETITVVINNTPRIVEVINGEASFNVSGFEPGQYSVMGEFEDENYNGPVYDSAVFEVLYPNRILSIETADEIMEGGVAVINVTVTDSNGNKVKGTVVLNISGTEVVVIVDGNKSVEIADLPAAGIYTVNATLVEEGLYAEVVNDTETFKVSAKDDIVINVADVVITVGDTAVINASLHSSTAGENLTITVVGKSSQVVTIDDNGNASAEFDGLATGEYEIVVTYGGDDIWNAATANATLTVNQINTYLTTIKK
ncbi:MAG: right-handed parallel beta-helix repeat-containing protein [Methanobrevibacter sp.]|nr:right-handed parallel beta-helix repeat-containing protein [Methanobrevibacter sp.]